MGEQNSKANKQDYAALYRIFFPKLVRFPQSYLLSEHDAENIVQDIFLYLWEHKETLSDIENLNAFLFMMVKNRCIDFLRKQTQKQDHNYSLTDIQEKELQLKLYSLQQFDENNFSRNHKLGLIYEKVGTKGKVLVCASDLFAIKEEPEVQALFYSILNYLSTK